MAISPGIPTSFVPRQPVPPTPTRTQRSGRDYFLMGALVLAGIAAAAAAGTFLYSQLLNHTLASKNAELAQATANVDKNTVDNFVRLHNRLSSGKTLLANHIMLSSFFDDLEQLTLQNVRFSGLSITVAGDHSATISLSGTAKNFNALAAQSTAVAGDKRIKRAIFSNISVNQQNQVTFKLSADLDPSLIIASNVPAQPAAAGAAVPTPTAPTAATSTPVRSSGTATGAGTTSASSATTTP